MKYCFFFLLMILSQTGTSFGQDSLWTLDRCIDYAKANNLDVQQTALNERVAKMQLEQSKWSQLPNFSVSGNLGRSFGRSIDPTTNNFENSTYDYMGLNGSSNVLLFGWFQKRNTIAKNALLHQASEASLSQMQNDIALNIVNGYLRILLAKEQIKISFKQLEISNQQLERIQKMLLAGRSNGLDVAQIKTQLSSDSASYYKALLSLNQSIIDLKALLNFELSNAFDVDGLNNTAINEALLLDGPENIYNQALLNFGNIKSANLKIQSAQKEVSISKSKSYPQLSLGLSAGTNYSSTYTDILPSGEIRTVTWGKQFQNNFSQSISLGLSVPLFNGLSSKYSIKQAKLAVQNSILQSKEVQLKLKQDIYKAFNDMQTAFQTYKATLQSAEYAQTALNFSQKRYDKGLTSAIDLLIAQNTFFKSSVDAASAKYDLIFKEMVIDYYLGNGVFEAK